MKIVHVYKDYFPPTHGGIEQTMERLATGQVRAGHEVTVLCSAHGGHRTIEETVDGVRVIRVAEWGRALSTPFCFDFPRQLGGLRADIFHLQFPNPLGELSWLAARPRGAMVVSHQNDVVRQAWALPVYGPFLNQLFRHASRIMCSSDRQVDRSPFLRRVREKCRVVPLGIDLEHFRPTPAIREQAGRWRARYGSPLVLFIGRLRYYKGVDVLLRAMRDVHGRAVVVGDGPEMAKLRALHAELGLGGKVTLAGHVEDADLPAHIAAADVGVLPSNHSTEGFGLSMIETMAGGVPVVCTELGTGTSFVNKDGESGFVVPPNDPAALASALNRLLDDEALRQRLGAGARARAEALFSKEAMLRNTMAIYEEALGERASER